VPGATSWDIGIKILIVLQEDRGALGGNKGKKNAI